MNKRSWKRKFINASSRMYFNTGGEGDGAGAGAGGDGAGAGGGTTPWFESLPEDVRGWDEVKNSETPDAFWQQMSSHRQHLGQSIRIPGPDAGKEDWDKFNAKLQDKVPTLMRTPDPEDTESLNSFYNRMGRPEAPDKYTVPEFKDGEGKPIEGIDHTMTEHFKAIAHANGLTQKQFEQIVSGVTNINLANAQQAQEQLELERTAISIEWGAAEDRNYTILKNFAKKTDAPEVLIHALEQKTLDHATAAWMLKAANASFGSENRGVDDRTANEGVMTPAEAKTRHQEIMQNREHPYWNKMDPGHKAAVARVRELIILQDPKNATKPAPGSTFSQSPTGE